MKETSLRKMILFSLVSVLYLWANLALMGRPSIAEDVLNEPLELYKTEQVDQERLRKIDSSFTSTTAGDILQPTFDDEIPINVTTQLGKRVYLHCVVHNLGDKTVSWIRRNDFHVLSVGQVTYTAEKGFKMIHVKDSNDWILQIELVKPGDTGFYECQVNTHPMISYFVYLTVLVPEATIAGAPDLHFDSGSTINLTCIIKHSPSPPVFVFWYHGNNLINYDSSRGQTTLQKVNGDTAVSSLYIKNAKTKDSGNYTCGPSNADSTSISVHVLNGEQLAAMQHDVNTSSPSCGCYYPLPPVVIILIAASLLIRPC
ncbi:zwei Ig domain protein zig-8-like isoform X2 [Limulus polyphemus]|uniref:Zwei Ig domain protein zig-8-like isoform X2 n=1 Tax=Limulus polyphemus TaxID=6850 RepID=A0ABM1T9V8_LIMPO|nr:zwei Ig domain protein zig-8-like isoform X2 [Limulus polyphemus]